MNYVFVPAPGFAQPFAMKMDNGFLISTPNQDPVDELDEHVTRMSFDGYLPLVLTFREEGVEFSQKESGRVRMATVPGKIHFLEGAAAGDVVEIEQAKTFFKMAIEIERGAVFKFKSEDGRLVAVS